MRPYSLFALLLLLLISCTDRDAERVVPPSLEEPPAVADEERRRALNTALDTLEALVVTLESIRDPISAWNNAADAARLLTELERTQPDYALGTDEHEAARLYPAEIDRLKHLEARQEVEMNRIMGDREVAQVLLDEMVEARQAASEDSASVAD